MRYEIGGAIRPHVNFNIPLSPPIGPFYPYFKFGASILPKRKWTIEAMNIDGYRELIKKIFKEGKKISREQDMSLKKLKHDIHDTYQRTKDDVLD